MDRSACTKKNLLLDKTAFRHDDCRWARLRKPAPTQVHREFMFVHTEYSSMCEVADSGRNIEILEARVIFLAKTRVIFLVKTPIM